MKEQSDQGDNWRVFRQFPKRESGKGIVRAGSEALFFSVWYESNIFLEIVGAFMMRLMCEPPRVIWHQQARMNRQSDSMIEPSVLAEGTMAALVGDLPKPSKDKALAEAVCCPGEVPDVRVLKVGNLGA